MNDLVYNIKNISYRYNSEVAALNDVSFSVARGSRVAIMGANGSGKSTLLRILDGLYFPDKGTVQVFGENLNEEHLQDEAFAFRFRQRVALVFQNPDVQLFNPTVFDEIAFGPLQMRWPKEQIRQKVDEMLNLFEIKHLKDRSPHRLSGGEKKRVALASVLILDPEVLLMDEPTAALDPKSQSMVIDFLSGWANSGKTVITTTHDLSSVAEIADHCLIFQRGKLVTQGAPTAILSDTTLLEQTNLIHAHRHSHDSQGVHSHPHLHVGHEHPHEAKI
ncbi:MAG: ABC transporter ATP-binding protein [Caldilineaceae bacterium]